MGLVLYSLLVVGCVSPFFLLRSMPVGIEAKVITAVATILFVFAAGVAASWRWVAKPKRRLTQPQVILAGSWLIVAAALTMAVAATSRWGWLLDATGVAAFVVGVACFTLLERGRAGAFTPRPRAFLNGAAAVACAWVPLLALWAWTRLG